MTNSQLREDPFADLSEAFQIVGIEIYGESWNADCVQYAENKQRRDVISILFNALKSGQVNAHSRSLDFQHQHVLRPIDVDHEFFQIMPEKNQVFHPGYNEPATCRISKTQLIIYIRGVTKRQTLSMQKAKSDCQRWLIELFSNEKEVPPTKGELREQAQGKFQGLSARGFNEVWKSAIETTGRHQLAQPGRRKNQITT